ncbi:MAG: large-conductance mechanosensitive channel protein MscL [Melioribacteraceae bacterium]
MKIVKEFKEFISRGNVVDMAVGIIMGAAFGKIVSSLVGDVILPPIGVLLGGVDFSNLSIVIKEAKENSPAVVIGYGKFIQTLVDFLIIAFAVFFGVVKPVNALKKKIAESPKPETAPSKEIILLTEIRDLLKKQ